nr:MAG TPA: hypothetical protein [Caudoviricetes sp.]
MSEYFQRDFRLLIISGAALGNAAPLALYRC